MSEATLRNLIDILSDIFSEMMLETTTRTEQIPYYSKFSAITDMINTNSELRRTCWDLLNVIEEHEDENNEALISEEEIIEIENLLR